MALGSVWASGSWDSGAWADGAWADQSEAADALTVLLSVDILSVMALMEDITSRRTVIIDIESVVDATAAVN